MAELFFCWLNFREGIYIISILRTNTNKEVNDFGGRHNCIQAKKGKVKRGNKKEMGGVNDFLAVRPKTWKFKHFSFFTSVGDTTTKEKSYHTLFLCYLLLSYNIES